MAEESMIARYEHKPLVVYNTKLGPKEIISLIEQYNITEPDFVRKNKLDLLTELDFRELRILEGPDESGVDKSLRMAFEASLRYVRDMGNELSPEQLAYEPTRKAIEAERIEYAHKLIQLKEVSGVPTSHIIPFPQIYDIDFSNVLYVTKEKVPIFLQNYVDVHLPAKDETELNEIVGLTTELFPGFSGRTKGMRFSLQVRDSSEHTLNLIDKFGRVTTLSGSEEKIRFLQNERFENDTLSLDATIRGLGEGVYDMLTQGRKGEYIIERYDEVNLPQGLKQILDIYFNKSIREIQSKVNQENERFEKIIQKLRKN